MSDQSETVMEIAKPYFMTFFQEDEDGNQQTVGEFWYDQDEKVLKFKGDVDESGKIFVDFIKEGFRLADSKLIDIVFERSDGPGPGDFVEVEDKNGFSIIAGQWIDKEDGYIALRITL